jgi:enoyl-CoA hydratase/carnithine racemase
MGFWKVSLEERMTYEHILADAENGVGVVTLNRPDKLTP